MLIMSVDLRLTLNLKGISQPIIIAGLPGMGLTGKQAVDYLIETFHAKKVGGIDAPYLSSPVITTHDGLVDDLMSELFSFYCARVDDKDYIFFTGVTQPPSPEWQHRLSYMVIDNLMEYSPKMIFTLAATPIFSYKWEVSVYGVATRRDLLEELRLHGVIPMVGEGVISGVNGLLIGYGKMRGVDGVVLMGETYFTNSQDMIAPLAVLRTLSRILDIDIDLKRMEERALSFHKEYTAAMAARKEERDKGSLGYIS
jgi:hypothetical protein